MGSNTSRPANYDSKAYALLTVFLVLTTIATTARVWGRYLQRVPFKWDDGLAYAAYLCTLATIANEYYMISLGPMNLEKLMVMGPGDQRIVKRTITASSVLYSFTLMFVKLSMLMLIRRIFTLNQKWFRIFWWINFVIAWIWTFSTFAIFTWLQIVTYSFDSKISGFTIGATTTFTAFSDILLLILPIRSVLSLQLSRGQKRAVVGLFGLGLLTTMVSLARMGMSFYQTTHVVNWNPAYSTYIAIMFSTAEASAAVMCACLPATRPALLKASYLANRGYASLASLVTRPSPSQRQNSETDRSLSDANSWRKKHTITRTDEVEVDSIPLKKSSSMEDSFKRGQVLGCGTQGEQSHSVSSSHVWA